MARPDRRLRAALRSAPLRAVAVLALPLLVALGLAVATSTPPPAEDGPTFAEEFGSGALDAGRWAVETPWHTQFTTGELEWYDPANVTFPGGGILRITSRKQRVQPSREATAYRYTSGIISSGSRAEYGGTTRSTFTYGYFEMRAKLPRGRGIWPAFWLTNDRTSEIDVMEMLGHEPNKVYMTLHQSVEGTSVERLESFAGPDFSAGYHTFAVDWQPAYVRYYVDGMKRAEFTENIPSEALWIVANTAVGGEWPGSPDSTTVFPQYYDIDYIRVWPSMPDAFASNRAPTADADGYGTSRNTTLTVAAPGVLANDSDPDGDELTAALAGRPLHGTATLGADGAFTYVPAPGYAGVDTFTYTASDGKTTANAVVTVTVRKGKR